MSSDEKKDFLHAPRSLAALRRGREEKEERRDEGKGKGTGGWEKDRGGVKEEKRKRTGREEGRVREGCAWSSSFNS